MSQPELFPPEPVVPRARLAMAGDADLSALCIVGASIFMRHTMTLSGLCGRCGVRIAPDILEGRR